MRHVHLHQLRGVLSGKPAEPMIVAIGTDIVDVERIRQALAHPRTGARFRARVFTPGEIEYCAGKRRSAESFAARFAAKEAVMKVLGRGFGDGIGWQEIEVARADGPPLLTLRGKARQRARELGVTGWHLSLTHTAAQAMAFVVAERA